MTKEKKGKKENRTLWKKEQTNLKKNNIEMLKYKQYRIFKLKKKHLIDA